MQYKYELNPCMACKKKYEEDDCNINLLNSCCTETAAAFSNFSSNLVVSEGPAGPNWATCMLDAMTHMDGPGNPNLVGGRTPCDLNINPAPVWIQQPHFLPQLLEQTNGNKEKALQLCYSKCNNINSQECQINCTTDYNALVKIVPVLPTPVPRPVPPRPVPPRPVPPRPVPRPVPPRPVPPRPVPPRPVPPRPVQIEKFEHTPSPQKTYDDIAKDKPIYFYSGFILVAILLAFILVMFFLVITSKNIGIQD